MRKILLALALLLLATQTRAQAAPAAGDLVLYGDTLQNGFTDDGSSYLDDIRLVGATPPPPHLLDATIQIQTQTVVRDIDAKTYGTNAPAWLGSNLANSSLRARTAASGAKFIRIPGGSWSDAYGWLSCEMGADQANAYPCGDNWASWAAKPSDFINFVKSVGGGPVIYTMNVNVTPQEAAAAVAFFNATPGNTTVIGMDSHGKDWKTAGHWARLRADHGNPAPLGIQYWEIGNEVYGGQTGTDCLSWGWENTWTCDGTEYVNGIAGHAGFKAMRAVMRAVDPTILVGAVGTEDPADYSNWGNEVIAAAGAVMDFYIVHPYAYYQLPPNNAQGYAQILAQPATHWRDLKTNLHRAFDQYAGGRQIPIAATEYNLASVQDQDKEQLMTRAVNALFIADSIGQALQNGFMLTNQWDLANGCASNGTCYDLLQLDNAFRRAPQYYAFPLWARFGHQLLGVTSSLDAASQLGVYAGRVDENTVTLLAVNKTDGEVRATISLDQGQVAGGSADVMQAAVLGAKDVTFNQVADPSDDLSNAPALPFNGSGNPISFTFAPTSITVLKLDLGSSTKSVFLPFIAR